MRVFARRAMQAGRPVQFQRAPERKKPAPYRGVPARQARPRKLLRNRLRKRPRESAPYRFAQPLRARALAGSAVFPTARAHGFQTPAHPARLLVFHPVFLPVFWTLRVRAGAIARAIFFSPPRARVRPVCAPMRAHPAIAWAARSAHCIAGLRGPHRPATKSCARPHLGFYCHLFPNLRANRHTRFRQMAACRACSNNPRHRGGRARESWRHRAGGVILRGYQHQDGLAVLCHIHLAYRHWRATAHRRQLQNRARHFAPDAPPDWRKYPAKTQLALPAPWPRAPSSPALRGFAHPYRA